MRDAARELADRIQPLRVGKLLLAAAALERGSEHVGHGLQEVQLVVIEVLRLVRGHHQQPHGLVAVRERHDGRVAEFRSGEQLRGIGIRAR